MKLTQEYINIIAPEHSRTSCSDDNVCNGEYEIDEKKLRGVLVERYFVRAPRCTRCFLLLQKRYNDGELDPNFIIRIYPTVELVQPEFIVKAGKAADS